MITLAEENYLKAILSISLNKDGKASTNEIAHEMKHRGYGAHYPRSVIHPIKFSLFNLIQVALIAFFSSYLSDFV